MVIKFSFDNFNILKIDDEYKEILKEFLENFDACLYNGYFVGVDKNKNLIYFHRYLASKIFLEDLKNKNIHHRNGDKYDNTKSNLEIMSRNEHEKYHLYNNKFTNAFFTWRSKTNNNNIDDFINWMSSKGQNYYALQKWRKTQLDKRVI